MLNKSISDAEYNSGAAEEEVAMDGEGLIAAIKAGETETVKGALAAQPGLAESVDENGVSALLVALYHRQRDLAEVVAGAKATLDVFEATAVGRAERLGELVRSDPGLARARSADGFTALHYACFFGQPACARLLVGNGADVEATADNPTRVRPLHSAAAARQRATVELLLDQGADPDARQQRGYTALQSAAHSGDRELVELLLARGADRSLRNEDGKDAAALARESGHVDLARELEKR
jgi:hypothetical protein